MTSLRTKPIFILSRINIPLRFLHRYVCFLTADINTISRQIKVRIEDRALVSSAF